METVRGVMRGRHGLRPAQKDDFAVETSEGALDFFDLRYARGNEGFAGLTVAARPTGCLRWVPPWVPPRADLLDPSAPSA